MRCQSPRLTASLRQQIVAAIRSGGYAQVAAQARGVSPRQFQTWLERGRGEKAREPYASFARLVDEAQAQARLRAEVSVFEAAPRIWLEHGPGRETAASPGWSSPVAAADPARSPQNVFLNPLFMRFCEDVSAALASYPEPRQIVASLIERHAGPPRE